VQPLFVLQLDSVYVTNL